MAKKKINCSELFDSIQDFLWGEHGSPTMSEPYRDLSGNLVFEDCDGHEFSMDHLVYWYEDLVSEGLIKDTLEIVGKNVDIIDDYYV